MKLKHTVLVVSLVCVSLASVRVYGADGYFRVEQRSGVWWLVAPSGQLMISAGVDNVSYRGDAIQKTKVHPYFDHVSKLYPTENDWARAEIERLRSWGFNNLGAWTDPFLWNYKMPRTSRSGPVPGRLLQRQRIALGTGLAREAEHACHVPEPALQFPRPAARNRVSEEEIHGPNPAA
ncbi:MAG: hypothetical protein P8Z30_04325 [Acidobacteriota bacterium]